IQEEKSATHLHSVDHRRKKKHSYHLFLQTSRMNRQRIEERCRKLRRPAAGGWLGQGTSSGSPLPPCCSPSNLKLPASRRETPVVGGGYNRSAQPVAGGYESSKLWNLIMKVRS